MGKFFIYLICHCLYPFSFLVPRTKKILVFGSFRGAFNDNTKYLFINAQNKLHDKRLYWITPNRNTAKQIREKGLKAYWVASPKGIWFSLRAKYWFVNAYTSDILYCFSGGATVVNLWHGVGLKHCEFNTISGMLVDRYVKKTLKERFFHPESFRRPDYFLSSTDFQSQMFAPAFRIPIEKCMNLGYPRNTILLQTKEEILKFVDKYEPQTTRELIDTLQKYDCVYMYMPTWRDSQLDVFIQQMDLQQLEPILAQKNALLLLKPHANTIVGEVQKFEHIQLINSTTDVYCILPFTDVLITDYSSILYDYLLLDGKGVILYVYDIAEYVQERDFYYPFDENVAGERATNFEQLKNLIINSKHSIPESERNFLLNKFWGDTMKSDVCKNIFKHLGIE